MTGDLAAGTPGPPGKPAVLAKGLERILLLKRVTGVSRLDVWPFLVLYALILVKTFYHASRFEWWVTSRTNNLLCT